MFNGSNDLLRADRHVRSIPGNVTRFPDFQPRSVPAKEIMEVLLHYLYAHNICYLGRVFATYVAQIFNSYDFVRLYVALSDSPIQNLLFQTVGGAETFTLEGFEFELLDHQVENDILVYDLTYGEFRTRLYVWVIDSVKPCGPESNVDFVNFVWGNRDDFSFLNYAITVHPLPIPAALVLRRYTSVITGQRATGGTTRAGVASVRACVAFNYLTSTTIANPPIVVSVSYGGGSPLPCRLPANTLLKYAFNLDLFQLRRVTTYSLYVYAVASNRIPPSKLLPTSFPFIRIVYGSDRARRLRRHYDCPGDEGGWHGTNSVTYVSQAKAIVDFVRYKELFLCEFCSKPLFFPPPHCMLHMD